MNTLKELAKEAHQVARSKGWYDKPRTANYRLDKIKEEADEAQAAFDAGNAVALGQYEKRGIIDALAAGNTQPFEARVKDGLAAFGDELADIVIRTLDTAEFYGIDIDWHVRAKMEYNKTRPYLHGKSE